LFSHCFSPIFGVLRRSHFFLSAHKPGRHEPYEKNFEDLQRCANDTGYSNTIRQICSLLSKEPGFRTDRVYFVDKASCLEMIKSDSSSDDRKHHIKLFKALLDTIATDEVLSNTLSLIVTNAPNSIKPGELSVSDAIITAKLQNPSLITTLVLQELKVEADTCQQLLAQGQL